MGLLFTSESVSEGHPDKVCDQISDALLDEFLRQDPNSKVACETLATTGLVVCAGEVKTRAYVDVQETVRNVINSIGYNKGAYRFSGDSCGVLSAIHEQSPDINQGVERVKEEEQGAGDQGIMFGYACTEMENYMPMPVEIAHRLVQELAAIRKEGKQMTYLRPDAKSQVTVEYENGKAIGIDTIVLSTQHDDPCKGMTLSPEEQLEKDNVMQKQIEKDVREILIPRVAKTCPADVQEMLKHYKKLYVNPTGKFIIGGPHGDTGLTGRKIIVDTYGGRGAHGGGAFSGKDSSKVDRSAAYAARYIAKNMVAANLCDEVLVQVAYAIGVAQPVGVFVNTYGTSHITKNGQPIDDATLAAQINALFNLTPAAIIKRFGLKNPIFKPTASYGHFGRDVYEKDVDVFYEEDAMGNIKKSKTPIKKRVKFFGWEELDSVPMLCKTFGTTPR